jgi:hypothetical protein
MALVSASKYVSKPFGEYAMQVCKKTKYFDALHLLDVYNESHEEQKIRKMMVRYTGRPNFIKQTYADFDFIAGKKLIDYEYLNLLISQENSEDSEGSVLEPSLISTETAETDLCAIEKDIKFQYMIRKISDARGKILSLDVNPMSAVGLAMWLSPEFGAKVKDVFLRFIEGDVHLLRETIKNLNITTGLVNNLETTTDPDTNEVAISITTFEKNNYMAKIKNDRHKREIQQLIDEKNGVITKQKSEIDRLIIQLKESDRKADAERKKAEEERKNAEEERKKADARFNKLLGVAEKSDAKLDAILPQRVNIDMNTDPDVPNVYILLDKGAVLDEYDLYVIRCQASSYDTRLKAVRKTYGKKIVNLYTFKQPNAIAFWKSVKKDLSANISKDSSSNWFKLKNMTISVFEYELKEHDLKRTNK